ncbi:hypothetical protein [Chryseobacterium sp. T20]|uniref:hypothetical protein n=1 Tax=Chryseobacterium sp. T20 TaxID=3395375 RepID=UPI0039BD878D
MMVKTTTRYKELMEEAGGWELEGKKKIQVIDSLLTTYKLIPLNSYLTFAICCLIPATYDLDISTKQKNLYRKDKGFLKIK